MTQIRNQQAYNSDVYTDNTAPAAAMEPAISTSNLQVDLNNVRSILNDIINGQTGNWFDGVAGRSVDTLDTDLTDLEDKTILCRISTLADVAVGAAVDFVVLTSPGQTPTEVAAIGVVLTQGAVCAELAGAVGTGSATVLVPGQNDITPKDLCTIIDTATGDVVTNGAGDQVFGLLQIANGATDGDAFDNAGNAAQLSFVVVNAGRTGFDLSTAAAGLTIEYAYIARFTLDTIPEECFAPWPGGFVDQAAAVDVTRQNSYNNQGTTAVDLLVSATLDLETAGITWSIRDDLEASLFAITEGSAGGTSQITFGAVDTFDNNAAVNDFDAGATLGSGLASSIDVAVASGLIEASAGLTMESNAANNSMITTGGGSLILDSSTNVDIDATTAITVNATTTLAMATANAADASANDITLTAGNSTAGNAQGGGVTINTGDGFGTGSGGDLSLDMGTDGGGAPGVPGLVDIISPADEDQATLRLSPAGTNAEVVSFYSGSSDPNTVVTATRGSLFLRDNGATGQVWVNTDDATAWDQLQAGAATTTLSQAITNQGAGNFTATNSTSWSSANGDSVDFAGPGGGGDTILEINALAAGDTVIVNGGLTATGDAGAPGQTMSITGGAGAAATDSGGGVTLLGGDGNTSGGGGVVSMTGGQGGTSGNGAAATVTAGAGGPTSGDGGDVTITGGGVTDGNAGDANVAGGAGGTTVGNLPGDANFDGGDAGGGSTSAGGAVNMTAGDGDTAAGGGNVNQNAGNGGSTGNGGIVAATGGDGGGVSGDAGGFTAQGGTPTDGDGGAIALTGSAGVGTDRSGGTVTLTAGASTGTADGANIVLVTGTAGGSGAAGSVAISGANDEDEALATLTTSGTGGDSASLFVGGIDPSVGAGIAAPVGSFMYRDEGNAGTTGSWYGKTGAADTAWEPFQTGTGDTTLSEAIDLEGSGNFTAANGTSWGNGDNASVDFTGPGGGGDTILEINALAAGDTVVVNGGLTVTGDTGAPGQTHSITGGAGAAATDSGGGVTLLGGDGNTSGGGGVVSMTGGQGGASGNGAAATVTAGAGGPTSGDGGDVTITGGGVTDGNAGDANVTGGAGGTTVGNLPGDANVTGGNAGGSSTSAGGAVNSNGGNGDGAGGGGNVNQNAGNGGSTGIGGDVTATGGDGGSASGDAGGFTAQGGTPTDGDGGAIALTGSAGVGTDRSGGTVTLTAGASTGTADGANIVLVTGTAGGSGAAGSVAISGANDEDEALATLTTGGTGGDSASLFIGGIDPSAGGGVAAPVGSFFYRDEANAGTTGSWYGKTGAADTAWDQFVTGAVTADTWAAVLVQGALSGGTDPQISSGDNITGIDDPAGSGTGFSLIGGAHTGAAVGPFQGGDMALIGGASDASANGSAGGDVSVTGGEYTGVGGGLSKGGDVDIAGGAATAGGGDADGGDVTVTGGEGFELGGDVFIAGGVGGTTFGGDVSITGGQGAGDAGDVNVTGGLTAGGNAADDGGAINITSGTGTAAPFNTGAINILVPQVGAVNVAGGSITLSAGNTGTRNVPGGDVHISAGNSAGGGAERGGEVTITAGNQTGGSGGEGGSVTVTLGDSTNDIPGVFVVTGPSTQTEELVTLTTTGTGGDSAQLFVGGVDPSAGAGVAAPVGSFFYRDEGNAGTVGGWFGKTGAANTAWDEFLTGAAGVTSLSGAITEEGSGNFLATNSTSWGQAADGQSVDFTGPGGGGDTILEINALAAGDTVVINAGLTATGDTGAPGQTMSVTGGAGAAATDAGGPVTFTAGAGNTSGGGGLASLTGGAGGASGTGGGATLAAGAGGGTTGNGGNVTITGGGATDGNGGNVLVESGDGTGADRDGGTFAASSGDATGSGTAGALAITAGSGGATGTAGALSITSGAGGSASGGSGAISIATGAVTDGDPGSITLDAANSTGGGTNGGDVILDAGDSLEQEGGLIIVRPGDSTTLAAGYLWLDTPNDDDMHIVQLTTGGTNGTTTHIHTGDANPDGVVNAPGGSLYLRRVVAASGSSLFLNVSEVAGEGTDWDEVFTSSSRTFVQGTSNGTVAVSTDISDQAPASNVTMDFGTFPTFPSTQAAFNTQTKIYINGLLSANATDAVRSGVQTTAFQLATTALVAADLIVVEQWPD